MSFSRKCVCGCGKGQHLRILGQWERDYEGPCRNCRKCEKFIDVRQTYAQIREEILIRR